MTLLAVTPVSNEVLNLAAALFIPSPLLNFPVAVTDGSPRCGFLFIFQERRNRPGVDMIARRRRRF